MAKFHEVIRLEFNSKTAYIDLAQSIGEKLFETLDFRQDQIYWMSIALREAVNNAIKHGNKENSNKRVFIDFHVFNDKLQILIKDEGTGFDISTIPDPTEEENILKPSGRGLFFIRSFMDEINVVESGEKGTLLELVKYRKQ